MSIVCLWQKHLKISYNYLSTDLIVSITNRRKMPAQEEEVIRFQTNINQKGKRNYQLDKMINKFDDS
jgi:hypothetical protein